MTQRFVIVTLAVALSAAGLGLLAQQGVSENAPLYHSPIALALSPDRATLYVADYTADAVWALSAADGKVLGQAKVQTPTGLVASPDGKTLYVASADPDRVLALELPELGERASLRVGRRPVGLTLSPDGQTLYCCNQLSDSISVIATGALKETARLKARREPRFCALGNDAKTLVVANELPLGSNMDDFLGAEVSLINLADGQTVHVKLCNGATDVGQVICSPDGKYAYIAHVLARWLIPPTQLDRGWIATNALTVVDVAEGKRVGTVLLDDLDRGAANPYGLALSASGDQLFVTHSGTHEVQAIDAAGLLKLITTWPADARVALEDDLTAVYRSGIRKRIPCGGEGPRGIVALQDSVLVGNYFSGTVTRIGVEKGKVLATYALGTQPAPDVVRRGEMLFCDARPCFQGWQSCVTCHPEGRSDGLAWDLLNDGIGNPKNAKSLVLSGPTPPVMAHGVRSTMEVAVAAGFKYILFHPPTQEEIETVSAYVNSMKPERSPYVQPDGSLSPAARRGKALFESAKVDCARCHPAPLYTDLHMYDVGTRGKFDERSDFDTPTLVELFRTAPYLHDGSAVTMREVLKEHNLRDQHGVTSHLTERELDDLTEYLLSL